MLVEKHDGEAIANDIVEVFKSDQLAGSGIDGQYFKLNVPDKLKQN